MMIDGTTDIDEAKKWMRTQIILCDNKKLANGQKRTLEKYRLKDKVIKCTYCKVLFTPDHPTRTLCSVQCQKERRKERARKRYVREKPKYREQGKKRQNHVRLKRGTFARYAKVLENVGYKVIPPKELKL